MNRCPSSASRHDTTPYLAHPLHLHTGTPWFNQSLLLNRPSFAVNFSSSTPFSSSSGQRNTRPLFTHLTTSFGLAYPIQDPLVYRPTTILSANNCSLSHPLLVGNTQRPDSSDMIQSSTRGQRCMVLCFHTSFSYGLAIHLVRHQLSAHGGSIFGWRVFAL